jgi:hypothetical protein
LISEKCTAVSRTRIIEKNYENTSNVMTIAGGTVEKLPGVIFMKLFSKQEEAPDK